MAPISDLIISKGRGYNMGFMHPGVCDNLAERFFRFFGELGILGITPGMRIEIAIILLLCLVYFYAKTKNIIKSILGMLACYSLLFVYLALPFIIKRFVSIFGVQYQYSNKLVSSFLLLIGFFEIIFLAFLINKNKFLEIVRNLRFSRLIYYLFLFVLGFAIGGLKIGEFYLTEKILFNLILVPISFLFAWLFSIITNDIEDIDIDRISNTNRPLVNLKSAITKEEYKKIAWISLALAIIYGATASQEALFIITFFIGNYFLYSIPPLRLKRMTFFSKIFIGLNSLAMIMLGYALLANSILSFPPMIIAFVLIGFTAVANFIDIKDYEGDKSEGIRTLPVVMGLEKAKWLIGIMFLLMNLAGYFFIKDISFLPFLIGLGLIELYFVTKEKYDERPVFLALLTSILLLAVYLIFCASPQFVV
jgi:4-hydroxybenzoate polyprenyltransferase